MAPAIDTDRMFQMVKDSYPQPKALKRLKVVLLGAMMIVGHMDEDGVFAAAFKKGVDKFIDRFGTMSKKVDELAARLLKASLAASTSASAFASQLAGLHADGDIFSPLQALRLPAKAPEEAHLEVTLAAQRLRLHDEIDESVEFLEQKILMGRDIIDMVPIFERYLLRKKTLERIIKKHVKLAAKAAARPPATGLAK
ncbi:unnamed protein product [Alopecurus aequalis]